MSLRTCSCDLPQKLHLSWPFSSPNLNKRFVPLWWALLRRFRRALARLAAHHRIADPVGDCFLCSHVVIAFHVALDLLGSVACPPTCCTHGWWMRILEYGRANRLPFAPPVSSTDAALAASPAHKVATSGLTSDMV